MRLFISLVFLLCIYSCSSDRNRTQSKVLPPEKLKRIIQSAKHADSLAGRQHPLETDGSVIRSRKKRSKTGEVATVVVSTPVRPFDSSRVGYMNRLMTSEVKVDFSEPLNKEFLGKMSDSILSSGISLSRDRVLAIGFDNDIFDYTDRFYTNGISIQYFAPAISDNPVKHILLPYWSGAKNYYGLSLVQNLYTPSNTKIGGILYGDRPYAAYLYFGSIKVTNDIVHHYRQTSELDLGVIGKPSGGGLVQELFHKYIPYNNEPLGWEYQVCTDVLINYNFGMEKGILNREHIQLILSGEGSLGTLYTNFGGGFSLRLGNFNDYFSDLGIRKRRVLKESGERIWQYFFTVSGGSRIIAYDATLQGGLLNSNSPYTIPRSAVSNIVFRSSVGFTLTYGAIGIQLEQIVISPEFSHKWWHAWGHIGLLFAL